MSINLVRLSERDGEQAKALHKAAHAKYSAEASTSNGIAKNKNSGQWVFDIITLTIAF